MNRKYIVLLAMVSLLLFGWVIYKYNFQESAPLPSPAPAAVQPEPPQKGTPKSEPAAPKNSAVQETQPEKEDAPQSLSVEKSNPGETKTVDLESQSMSIRREADKGYKVMPGVTVEHNAVHVQMNEDKTQTLEIEKNPPNTNNEIQVLMKKKF